MGLLVVSLLLAGPAASKEKFGIGFLGVLFIEQPHGGGHPQ